MYDWGSVDGGVPSRTKVPLAKVASIVFDDPTQGERDFALLTTGEVVDLHSPTSVIGGLPPSTMIAASGSGTMYAVAQDGRVFAWDPLAGAANYNFNGEGQLGNGTTVDSSVPAPVQGITNARAVAAGVDTGYALLQDGTVVAWGGNDVGQLGDGKYGSQEAFTTSPHPIAGLSNIDEIAGAWQGALARTASGAVYVWGCDSSKTQQSPGAPYGLITAHPALVAGLPAVTAIAGSMEAEFALADDGTVWSWGMSGVSMGHGGENDDWYPPAPVAGLPKAQAIASTNQQTAYAIAAGGSLYSWGENSSGELGRTVSSWSDPSPAPVPGLTKVEAVGAGGYSAWAIEE